MKKTLLIAVVLMLVILITAGCGLTDKLSSLKEGFNEGEGVSVENQTPTVVIEGSETSSVLQEETKAVLLYFVDATGNKLVAEERMIPKVEGIARAAMNELIKGPALLGLQSVIPTSTVLLDINVRPEGLAIVDFSADLIEDMPISANAEKLVVYSIVNTLCQFPTVDRVEMRVDGKQVDTLLGFVDFGEEITANADLTE